MSLIKNIKIEHLDHEAIYKDIDLGLSLAELIDICCQDFNLNDSSLYTLLSKNDQNEEIKLVYLTEETIKSTENQTFLLDYKPVKMLSEIKENVLSSVKPVESLEKLSMLIDDPTFLPLFINDRGSSWLSNHFLSISDENVRGLILGILFSLCEKKNVQNDDVTDDFIDELLNLVGDTNFQTDFFAHIYFIISYFINNKYPDFFEYALERIQLDKLINSIIGNNPFFHSAILRFINTVFDCTPFSSQEKLAEVVLEINELRLFTYKYVINEKSESNLLLSKELTKLQRILNHSERIAFSTPVTITPLITKGVLKLLEKYDPFRELKDVVKLMGFKSITTFAEELQELPNMLVFDCFTFFITKNQNSAYYPDFGPPLITLISVGTIEFANTMRLMDNDETNSLYIAALFEMKMGFKEVVCKIVKCHKILLSSYDSTDCSMLLSHYTTRIRKSACRSFTDLSSFAVRFEKITKVKLEATMTETPQNLLEKVKNLAPANRLRTYYSPSVEQFLKKQFFEILKEGLSVELPLSQKKDKKNNKEETTLLQLNSTYTAFNFTIDNQKQSVNIADLKIYYGEAALPRVEEKIAKKVLSSALVVFETKDNKKYIFIIEPEKHKLIIDVVGFLENRKIDSDWQPQHYTEFLDCLIEVALMDLNESDIPNEPPPVPELPENFEFAGSY